MRSIIIIIISHLCWQLTVVCTKTTTCMCENRTCQEVQNVWLRWSTLVSHNGNNLWPGCLDNHYWSTTVHPENPQLLQTQQCVTSLNSNGCQFKTSKIGSSGHQPMPVSINARFTYVCGDQDMTQHHVHHSLPFSAFHHSRRGTPHGHEMHLLVLKWNPGSWIGLVIQTPGLMPGKKPFFWNISMAMWVFPFWFRFFYWSIINPQLLSQKIPFSMCTPNILRSIIIGYVRKLRMVWLNGLYSCGQSNHGYIYKTIKFREIQKIPWHFGIGSSEDALRGCVGEQQVIVLDISISFNSYMDKTTYIT